MSPRFLSSPPEGGGREDARKLLAVKATSCNYLSDSSNENPAPASAVALLVNARCASASAAAHRAAGSFFFRENRKQSSRKHRLAVTCANILQRSPNARRVAAKGCILPQMIFRNLETSPRLASSRRFHSSSLQSTVLNL